MVSGHIRMVRLGITGGHLSVRRTLDQVHQRAFWRGSRGDVDYVDTFKGARTATDTFVALAWDSTIAAYVVRCYLRQ